MIAYFRSSGHHKARERGDELSSLCEIGLLLGVFREPAFDGSSREEVHSDRGDYFDGGNLPDIAA
jgi:hypothetical protein